MPEPITPIFKSLQSLFQLEITRNGKYSYKEVQFLKETTDKYHTDPTRDNFIKLKKALKGSMSYIEKRQHHTHLNFDSIKSALDNEAQAHGLPPINWPKLLSHSTASAQFQFSALNHAKKTEDFPSWLESISGSRLSELEPLELAQLLVNSKDEMGFSKKLSEYIKEEPEFLFELMLSSSRCFSKIASTMLSLYLTDEQLAIAILQYLPKPAQDESKFYHQVNSIITKVNNTLSFGRSISIMLRNTEAKKILDKSPFFEFYQSEQFNNYKLLADKSITHAENELTPRMTGGLI